MENKKKVREQVKMSRNLYLRVIQRIVYFSLMIVTIVMRKLVEKILGFKIGRINLDRNLIEHEQEGWVLAQKVVSREYHLRWRPWLRWARPLPPPTLRRLTETSEEYDSLAPLPVIPKLKHVRSMPMVPSATEQRSPPNERKKTI